MHERYFFFSPLGHLTDAIPLFYGEESRWIHFTEDDNCSSLPMTEFLKTDSFGPDFHPFLIL